MNVEKIHKVIATKVMGWRYRPPEERTHTTRVGYYELSSVVGDVIYEDDYAPTVHAEDAFILVEKFQLRVHPPHGETYWYVDSWAKTTHLKEDNYYTPKAEAKHADLKTAICFCVLRMHGIDPETL